MKKTLFKAIQIAFIPILVTSCAGKSQSKNYDADYSDTCSVEVLTMEIPVDSFLSIDLKSFGLNGQVKIVESATDTLHFDDEGRLTKYAPFSISYKSNKNGFVTDKYGLKVTRDNKDRITTIPLAHGCGQNMGYTIEYNNDGRISYIIADLHGECEGIPRISLKYNDDGECVKRRSSAPFSDGSYSEEYQYSNYKYDEYYNWIERDYKCKSINETEFGNEVKNTKGKESLTILYY